MILSLSDTNLSLIESRAEDYGTLAEIYKSTRQKELDQVNYWTEKQKTSFLDLQFALQHTYYKKNYDGAAFYIIKSKSSSIGRLYIHPNFEHKSIRIIDIAILPKWQNKGFGTGILMDIQKVAEAKRMPVTIHVESFNPAMNLYKRLGFKKISETNGVYFLFEWTP